MSNSFSSANVNDLESIPKAYTKKHSKYWVPGSQLKSRMLQDSDLINGKERLSTYIPLGVRTGTHTWGSSMTPSSAAEPYGLPSKIAVEKCPVWNQDPLAVLAYVLQLAGDRES